MKNSNLKGSLILVTAALIWGLAFVVQSGVADLIPPFTFNALRSVVGAAALYIFWFFTERKKTKTFFPKEKPLRKNYYLGAVICGVCLAVSINFQQFGIAAYPEGTASEARSGFITALYVILVPIFSLILKKKVGLPVWAGVAIAVVGVYLLCFSGGVSGIYLGDFLVFLCAVSFSLHIMSVDKYVSYTGGVKLSIMQFSVAAVISFVLAFIFEWNQIEISDILSAVPQILYMGVMSSGVAYTLQIVGQKYAEPTVASISMSLESVFAALGGWVISGNVLHTRELIGCILVFAAIVVAQLPSRKPSLN